MKKIMLSLFLTLSGSAFASSSQEQIATRQPVVAVETQSLYPYQVQLMAMWNKAAVRVYASDMNWQSWDQFPVATLHGGDVEAYSRHADVLISLFTDEEDCEYLLSHRLV